MTHGLSRIMPAVGVLVLTAASLSDIAPALAQEPWPARVEVLAPDPVLGKQMVWQYWVYSEAFASRFSGFDGKRASKELPPGVFAIAFRTYKRRTFADLDLYHCEYEVYFDQAIKLSVGPREAIFSYGPSVSPSFYDLRPYRDKDGVAIASARMVPHVLRSAPVILQDGKVDSRYAWFPATNYFADLVDGLSMISLKTGFECRALAPKRPGSYYWLSLFGEIPFEQGSASKAISWGLSIQFQKWLHEDTFKPGPPEEAVKRGFIRLPEQLYVDVLPKIALIKSMNDCITARTGIQRRGKLRKGEAEILAACDRVEKRGEILDIYFGHVFVGRQEAGF